MRCSQSFVESLFLLQACCLLLGSAESERRTRKQRSSYMTIPSVDKSFQLQDLFMNLDRLPELGLHFSPLLNEDSFPVIPDSGYPSLKQNSKMASKEENPPKCCSEYRTCFEKEMKQTNGSPPLPTLKSTCYAAHRNKTKKMTKSSQLATFCNQNRKIFHRCMKKMISPSPAKGENPWEWLEKCEIEKRQGLTEDELFIQLLIKSFKFLCNYHYFQAIADQDCFRNKTRDCVVKYNKNQCVKSCDSEDCGSQGCLKSIEHASLEKPLNSKQPIPINAFLILFLLNAPFIHLHMPLMNTV